MTIGAPFISAKVRMASRLESVRGVAEITPVAGDTRVAVYDIVPDMTIDKIRQMVATGRYTEVEALIGTQLCNVKFKHDVRLGLGTGPSAVLPFDKHFRAMGQKPAATTGLEKYTPNDDQDVAQTETIWVVYPNSEQDEIVIGIKGCKGGGTLKIANGKPAVIDCEMQGVLFFAGPWSGTFPAYEISPVEQRAPVFLDGVMTINGFNRSISELTLSYGHTLTPVEDGSDDSGYAYVHIGDRKPTVSLKTRMDLHTGEEDLLLALRTPGNTPAIVLTSQSVTASLLTVVYTMAFTLNIGKLNVLSAKKDDIGTDVALAIEGIPLETSGGDEFSFAEAYAVVP